jgi:hypothetical protein
MTQIGTTWPTVRFGVIGIAWRSYQRHWAVWSLTMLIAMLCVGVGAGVITLALKIASAGMFGGLLGLRSSSDSFLHTLLGIVLAGFFLGGMIRMAVNQVRGRRPRIEDLFSVTDVWFDLLLGSLLLGVLLLIGLRLMIIPGLVVAGLFLFMYPLIVDARLPATGAMMQSWNALKSQWLLAAAVHLAIAAVAGVGTLLGGIGLLVTGPLYVLSVAVLYRDFFLNPYSLAWEALYDPG